MIECFKKFGSTAPYARATRRASVVCCVASMRLLCEICNEKIVGIDAVRGHVAGHRLVGDRYQCWLAPVNGAVLKALPKPD